MNPTSGLLTVDINTVNTEVIRVLVDYNGNPYTTNDFRVSVICEPLKSVFFAKPIKRYYRLHESATGLVDIAVVNSTEIKGTFSAETCRWCKNSYSLKLVHASNNSDYTGNSLQIESDFSLRTSTA